MRVINPHGFRRPPSLATLVHYSCLHDANSAVFAQKLVAMLSVFILVDLFVEKFGTAKEIPQKKELRTEDFTPQ